LSEALAVTETAPDTVAPFAGAVTDTVGGVVSDGFTVSVAALLVGVPAVLLTTTWKVNPLSPITVAGVV